MSNVRLYARVSHEEQAKKNISVPVQLEALKQYCKEHKHRIVGTYIDNGVSATSVTKRKEFLKMIDDCQPNDIILFTRLDRFSRNVLDANKIVQDLNKKNVSILSIFEDEINTSTADGLFMFNLRVSLSQREAGKCSERILDVMDSKIKKGEVLTGNLPLGYSIKDKKPVINDQAYIVQYIFDEYIDCGNLAIVARKVTSELNHPISASQIKYIIKNERYIGKFRNIDDYFPKIIDESTFYTAQKVYDKRYIKKSRNDIIYLFSGLCRCEICGRRMASSHRKGRPNTCYYICNVKTNGTTIQHYARSERLIEKELLKNLEDLLRNRIVASSNEQDHDYSSEINVVKEKMARLKDIYIDGILTKDEFIEKYNKLESELELILTRSNAPISKKVEHYEHLLNLDILSLYSTLEKPQKAIFWRTIIDYIVVHKDGTLDVYLQ